MARTVGGERAVGNCRSAKIGIDGAAPVELSVAGSDIAGESAIGNGQRAPVVALVIDGSAEPRAVRREGAAGDGQRSGDANGSADPGEAPSDSQIVQVQRGARADGQHPVLVSAIKSNSLAAAIDRQYVRDRGERAGKIYLAAQAEDDGVRAGALHAVAGGGIDTRAVRVIDRFA